MITVFVLKLMWEKKPDAIETNAEPPKSISKYNAFYIDTYISDDFMNASGCIN